MPLRHKALSKPTVLDCFIADCRDVIARTADAAERVTAIAPLMAALLQSSGQSISAKSPITTRAMPSTSAPTAISRCSLSYGCRANGRRCMIMEAGVWSAW